ncbi:MAG: type II secretion system protein [Candidatus Marinamargulisbacteria bacterium]
MRVKGFSLIELLVVIGVIALINVIMLPNYASMISAAKALSAKSTTRNLMVALEQYYFMHQTYPQGTNQRIVTVLNELMDKDIINAIPINPFTGHAYHYSDDSGQIYYTLMAADAYQIQLMGEGNKQVVFQYP